MKIVTVTCLRSHNYGAVLQAYALQKTILSLGYENELLDYSIGAGTKAKNQNLKAVIRNIFLSIKRLMNRGKYLRFCNAFKTFVDDNLLLTREYLSIEDLRKNPPMCDCFLTGSDQVFALGNQLALLRFLDFGGPDTLKVSYAASLGSYAMNDTDLAYVKERLSEFCKISIREQQGSEYLSETLGLSCFTHVDPVFLLPVEQWEMLAEKKTRVQGSYILVYPMIGNRNLQNVIDQVKRDLDLPVISLQNKFVKTVKADKYLYDVTVPEYLTLIKNASAVITTSFHTTCFSIIFKRPFYSLVGPYKPERAQNVCSLFELEDRVIVHDATEFPSPITNFEKVDLIIEREKARSIEYLASLRELQ